MNTHGCDRWLHSYNLLWGCLTQMRGFQQADKTLQCSFKQASTKPRHLHEVFKAGIFEIHDWFWKVHKSYNTSDAKRSIYSLNRCGKGVMRLLEDPEVFSFLHGTTLPSLAQQSSLVQPGKLRKVCLWNEIIEITHYIVTTYRTGNNLMLLEIFPCNYLDVPPPSHI